MKIDDVPRSERRRGGAPEPKNGYRLSGTRARVLEYLNEHSDEVFRISLSDDVATALGVPERTVEHVLWWLARQGLIGRARLDREVWYGSHAAIEKLTSLCPDAVRV